MTGDASRETIRQIMGLHEFLNPSLPVDFAFQKSSDGLLGIFGHALRDGIPAGLANGVFEHTFTTLEFLVDEPGFRDLVQGEATTNTMGEWPACFFGT
jgi:hypothetical protein